ncbi:Prestin Solute carrier family 26 member 5 [Takifugu flavidus]|uniref:Prestin Solute carrier family 26 member 5 n=2 Tax=Takifugu flavidus TaxID=433684 RepID=A0A5C6NBZ0_9TELE|nr:Prestin Solute carrier family 26 member 5 [Takifugu flavidus]
MSRSLVQESTGGKTQIAGLLSSIVVLLVIVAIGFVFQPLPQTALAAIIIVNLVGMFKQFKDISVLWRISKIELAIWLVAFVASVLLGLDYGLLVAITFALMTVIYRTQSPESAILGHIPGTGLHFDVEYEEAVEYEGIKIFHFSSPIYFANSDLYVTTLKEKTGVNPELLQAKRKTLKKHSTPSLKRRAQLTEQSETSNTLSPNHILEENGNSQVEDALASDSGEGFGPVHSIILDWTLVCFIDSVGAKAIKQVIKEYAGVDINLVIAGCSRILLSQLDALEFFTGLVTEQTVFPTINDAVLRCQKSYWEATQTVESSV